MSEQKLGVYNAIKNVMADMSKIGIAKDQKNVAQGFKFRGIDDVYNALSPTLAKHNLIMLPYTVERQVTERPTRNGGVMLHVVLVVDYTFICSTDGSVHVVRAYGEAMDSGDKATNKALASAYKYMCFQAFCIPIEGQDDADAASPEIAGSAPSKDKDIQSVELKMLLEALEFASTHKELQDFKNKNLEIIDDLSIDEGKKFVKAYNEHRASLNKKEAA